MFYTKLTDMEVLYAVEAIVFIFFIGMILGMRSKIYKNDT